MLGSVSTGMMPSLKLETRSSSRVESVKSVYSVLLRPLKVRGPEPTGDRHQSLINKHDMS
ncbi:hypothetical protein N7507_010584 [Penicillium longicatenatum]|nr:hypothetical protein N7507_010584 [Penicillium longicatenatum]